MRVAIFGGSGRTGRQVVEQALAAGHDVTILVREPAKVTASSQRLRVVAGNVQEAGRVEEAMRGAEAVISVLGPTRNEPVFEISAGMDNILAAMKQHELRRLIVTVGAAVPDPEDAPGAFHHLMNFLVKQMSRYVYADMAQVDRKVRASGLDWTIVRVPMLVDGPHSGQVKAGYVGKGMGPRVSRADLADFVIKQLGDETYRQKAPAISS